jgi:hypothetical protein
MKAIKITTIIMSLVLSPFTLAETTSEPCPGVKLTHHDDGTWTVNNHGSISSWGSGYTWNDLYETYCKK